MDNLRKRGINCEIGCSRCGALEETINHTLFLCHPARQIWALSHIPTVPRKFPYASIYANLDHLFWRIPLEFDSSSFPWIIWYIWKARNEKIFDNVDKDPLEILHFAEKESDLWKSAQLELRMVLYIINWRGTNFGSCQSQKKSISFTCRGGSSPLGDEVYDWCRQPRCSFSYRLFRSCGDGVFPNRMADFLIVFGGVTERQG
ncbi:putative reverse transcriptase zinc-binding domain-containing protein [Arabidopsis thaliana]